MKRFLSILLTLCLLLGSMSVALADEPTVIRIVWWGNQSRHDATTKAVELFMEKNPDIKVEIEFTDWGGYWSKLSTQAAGNLVPDVLQMDAGYLSQYAEKKIIADLTPYIENGTLDLTGIADTTLSSGKVGEGTYAVPTGTNALVLMYRKDVLDAAGLTMPMDPTESDYISLAKQVKEKTGKTTDYILYDFGGGLRYALRNAGLQLFADDGKALGFDDPKYLVHAWEGVLNAREEGWQLPLGESTATSSFDIFLNDVWAALGWTNQLAAIESGSNCELSMVVAPQTDDATTPSTYLKLAMFWAVSENSQNKEAAIRLINFFNHDTDCADLLGMDRGMPVASAVRDHLAPSLSAANQKVVEIMNYLGQEGKTSPMMPADPTAYGELEALYNMYFEEVVYGLVDDLTAHAQAFMDEANAILAK